MTKNKPELEIKLEIENKIIIILCLLFLVACNNSEKEKEEISTRKLISCENVLDIIQEDRPNYKIIDIRKKEEYLKNHIPKSINTWRLDYEDPNNKVKGMMADKQQMETLLQHWGVTTRDTLILYDGKGNSNACRLWWILRQYDYDNVKILDGSYIRWQQLNYPTDTLFHKPKKSNIQLKEFQPRYTANINDVQKHIAQQGIILDSRTIEEFDGKIKKGKVPRGGHIPKAIRFDWSELVKIGKDEDGTFRDLKTISEKLKAININSDNDIIVYCQSGVRSACVTFVLNEMMGYENIRNYDGSWLEWSSTDFPVEK